MPERGNAGCRKREESRSGRGEFQPARGEYAEDVPVRKQSDVAPGCNRPRDHAAGPDRYLLDRLAIRNSVGKQEPVRTVAPNLGGRTAFVIAVIPFEKVGLDFCLRAEARYFAGAPRAFKGAHQHQTETLTCELFADPGGLHFAGRRERKIGATRVCPRETPGGLSVPNEPNHFSMMRYGTCLMQRMDLYHRAPGFLRSLLCNLEGLRL